MLEVIVLVVGLAAIGWVSRESLRQAFYHAVPRFFGFIFILALVIFNLRGWFNTPLAWHQIISWLLLILSLALAVHSFFLLIALGKPVETFETTQHVVKVGAYRFIRHPLYASLVWFAWGVCFKQIRWENFSLTLAAMVCMILTAKIEEGENLRRFSDEYAEYMKTTRMFIPFVF